MSGRIVTPLFHPLRVEEVPTGQGYFHTIEDPLGSGFNEHRDMLMAILYRVTWWLIAGGGSLSFMPSGEVGSVSGSASGDWTAVGTFRPNIFSAGLPTETRFIHPRTVEEVMNNPMVSFYSVEEETGFGLTGTGGSLAGSATTFPPSGPVSYSGMGGSAGVAFLLVESPQGTSSAPGILETPDGHWHVGLNFRILIAGSVSGAIEPDPIPPGWDPFFTFGQTITLFTSRADDVPEGNIQLAELKLEIPNIAAGGVITWTIPLYGPAATGGLSQPPTISDTVFTLTPNLCFEYAKDDQPIWQANGQLVPGQNPMIGLR